jgi:hypothetical protein
MCYLKTLAKTNEEKNQKLKQKKSLDKCVHFKTLGEFDHLLGTIHNIIGCTTLDEEPIVDVKEK